MTDKLMLLRLTRENFMRVGIAILIFSMFAVPFGLLTGLFEFRLEADPVVLIRTAAIALILPALFEEVLFRGPIAWLSSIGSRKLLYVVAVSLPLFVLWHPFNGMFLMTEAQSLFTDWRFLVLAALLGLAATHLAVKTCSIWPPVLFHWLAIVGWKAFFGGPAFL